MSNELFDKGKEVLRSMSVDQLIAFKSKVQQDLLLESGTHPDKAKQKSYYPMPWMVPNMERAIKAVDELLEEITFKNRLKIYIGFIVDGQMPGEILRAFLSHFMTVDL